MKIYFDDDVYVSLCDYLYEYKCPQRSEALDPPGAGVIGDCGCWDTELLAEQCVLLALQHLFKRHPYLLVSNSVFFFGPVYTRLAFNS